MKEMLANLAVWYLNRYCGKRPLTDWEFSEALKFARLMANPDVNRIVGEKRIDYMGWKDFMARRSA